MTNRVLAKLSQEKLGELIGVSRQTINSIEKNRYVPSLPVVLKLAKFFNVTVEDIFHLKGEEHNDSNA
ncbi:helix-turn-helix transcriptional regulator [Enterococcus sp. DIV0755b]|uniref:helix-turn-helix transcriptional regulator n=1 Tax=Enterococcus sp. DIV0755b TaxID=2774657 RepID=UPI003F687C8E